jgi:hypothetical protein
VRSIIRPKAIALNDKMHPPADPDTEELSDSVLVEDRPGEKGLVVTKKEQSAPPPVPGPGLARTAVLLPKPNPPPRLEVAGRERSLRSPVDGDAAGENLPTVELRQLSSASAIPQASEQTGQAPPPPSPVPATTDALPARAAISPDIELTTIPRGMRSPVLSAMRLVLRHASKLSTSRNVFYDRVRTQGHEPGRKWPWVILVPAILGVGIGVVAISVGRLRGQKGATIPPAAQAESLRTATGPTPNPVSPPISDPPSPTCARTGEPHILAPKATLAAGVEVRAFGEDIALGFAANDHEAMLVRLEPKSLSVVESSSAASALPIRRVTPVPGEHGRLTLAVDVDRKGDPLRERRTLPIDPPLQVGVMGGHIAWAPLNREVAGNLWPLERGEAIEAVRGARSESKPSSVAIAFRSPGAEWVGAADGVGRLAAKGSLFRVDGLGGTVGAPAIAVNDGAGIMVWADRASTDDPWRLRWVRFTEGEAPSTPQLFAIPPGGNGDQAMSPGLAVIPGGRFLVTWTQGPTSLHEVRGLTIWADGTPLGGPLTISSRGSNAGQSQAAVAPDGSGIIAYLESSSSGFQVAVASISCGM